MKYVSLIIGLALLGLGCGPSFQAIYEGDARFEHCYALEEDPNVGMQYKSDCWRDWQKHYTYGQTRDRVQYAANRYAALTRAPANPTDEAMMGAAPGEEGEKTQLSAPAPTSAYTSPPKTTPGGNTTPSTPTQTWTTTAPVLDGGLAPSPVVTVPEPRSPLADCTDTCTLTWKACRVACEQGKSGCDACEKPYRACLKGCMK